MKDTTTYKTEVQQISREKEAKKEMKESGLVMTIAFVVMVFIWLIRKYLVKSQ
ncbi:MAG: hypothetical protein K0S23_2546 [Fluviicola sp.]|jgi:hypothetical protein|uniref:hypothetical protein n=1 Tax=Fluviicola sp. TaxID=1917219 RepID=UPI002634262E|nr:hypothetical protein [Fluviicola sp.]MDF3028239.1 hypothetical protein [Fluviicola sp.]